MGHSKRLACLSRERADPHKLSRGDSSLTTPLSVGSHRTEPPILLMCLLYPWRQGVTSLPQSGESGGRAPRQRWKLVCARLSRPFCVTRSHVCPSEKSDGKV